MDGGNKSKHTPNITKLPVLEYQKSFPLRNLAQSAHRPITEVVDDIGVGFEKTYGVASFLGKGEQLGSGGDIGREAQVRLLEGNEM